MCPHLTDDFPCLTYWGRLFLADAWLLTDFIHCCNGVNSVVPFFPFQVFFCRCYKLLVLPQQLLHCFTCFTQPSSRTFWLMAYSVNSWLKAFIACNCFEWYWIAPRFYGLHFRGRSIALNENPIPFVVPEESVWEKLDVRLWRQVLRWIEHNLCFFPAKIFVRSCPIVPAWLINCCKNNVKKRSK